ncbi:MAG: C40 family peptidase [Mogibacterium sp.]|nr:C40 family peptidase [Mogibacterium sp.]
MREKVRLAIRYAQQNVLRILVIELVLLVLLSCTVVTEAKDGYRKLMSARAELALFYTSSVEGVEDANAPLLEVAAETVDSKSFELYQLSVVKFADQWLGYPYVLGGRNIETGLDCAGFVNYVFRNAAGRDWSAMNVPGLYREIGGIAVSVDEMQPGDIIFFGSNQHIAIYAGDGQIVHAMDEENDICRTTLFRANGRTYSGKRIKEVRRVLEEGEQYRV